MQSPDPRSDTSRDGASPTGEAQTTAARPGSSTLWRVAAAGTAITAAALVVMAGTSLWEAVGGRASTSTRAVTEAVMLLVLAAGVVLLAVNLVRQRSLAKTPTLLWSGILVPVGISLTGGGARALGIGTIVVAVVTFVAALGLPRYELDDEEQETPVV